MEPIEMEDIYSTLPPEAIPWNIETPAKILVELLESKKVKPCKTIDLGCGIGYYAIYLANMGFDVTGLIFHQRLSKLLRKKHRRKESNAIL